MMYLFKIRSVERATSWINGVDAYIDFPEPSTFTSERICLQLIGWASSRFSKIDKIWLAWRGQKVAEAKMFSRPDIDELYDNCANNGFQIDFAPAILGDYEPLKVVIETEDGRSSSLFEIHLEYAANALLNENESSLKRERYGFMPVISLARSGTTHLLNLLYRHDMAIGNGNYPHETRIAEQLAKNWFSDIQPTACEPIWSHGGTNLDPTTHAIVEVYNRNTSETLHKITHHMALSSEHAYHKTTDLYEIISPTSKARFIAEKTGLSYELDLLKCIFNDIRPIYIIRDPRDIMVSMRKFNELNSTYDFEEAHSNNLTKLVLNISNALKELVWRYDNTTDPKLLIRYEDLVAAKGNVIERIKIHLGTELDEIGASAHDPTSEVLLRHVTASSPEHSIGRWREILRKSELETANWYFAPFLQRFEYEH